ncbi:hypothetical protein COT27_02160 [Candidatus Kuenenbacteria bacterium CG08_land_8_20_14_0_20_37_23]|uniref:Uncharacterized protein n=1 Tax=Candidatus Kuenenbacteria bacterium CG08_land_8_20_14_0_20_37_23 TaxID=1974617 RepID=A0A2M6XSP2_9BACT|nr:MAG: hypothetical protein COT27_02160 [Candidatus Kuenenbacteria bacterium CG08_land_8_20_14_0_20_37_23]
MKNSKSSNPKGSLLRAGGRGVFLGGKKFRPPYKFWAKSVRIFSNAHRQESHFEKSRLEASALRASAWYFSAILKAF